MESHMTVPGHAVRAALLWRCASCAQRRHAAAAATAVVTPAWRRGGAPPAASSAGPTPGEAPGSGPRRVAVIGGGFAGLAVSWHLLAAARAAGQPLRLQLFDGHGLGAGGSGAAAGLLHPYTPRGKLLWHGQEAFQAALELVAAAEAAAAASPAAAGIRRPFAWRTGMLRPCRSAKQAADVARFLPADPAAAAATLAEAVTDATALAALVPGLQPALLLPPDAPGAAAGAGAARKRPGQQQQRQQAAAARPALGLMVRAGVTVHPASYMHALWLACEAAAAGGGGGSSAELRQGRAVPSLARLQAEEGPFDAVVVAAGAAVDSVAELAGRLPLDLCHGYSLDVRPAGGGGGGGGGGSGGGGSGAGYPAGAPSLLGSPYIAAHGPDSLVVGATKRYGLTPTEAYAQLSRPAETDPEQAAAAAAALLPPAAQLWPPLAGWQVQAVRAGVRALPVRGADGAIPYAGRVDVAGSWGAAAGPPSDSEAEAAEQQHQQQRPAVWVVGGLGARGLVYHAWLGRLVAAAVLADSEAGLPAELLRWRPQAA